MAHYLELLDADGQVLHRAEYINSNRARIALQVANGLIRRGERRILVCGTGSTGYGYHFEHAGVTSARVVSDDIPFGGADRAAGN